MSLNFISDADMYLFVGRGMGGGVPYILKRYGKVDNKYLKSYDLKQESKLIICLDAINLYGYAMYKLLPGVRFK